jgi:dTMP kinase
MIKNPYPGKFIVFEGLDGSGKSTQAALLVKELQEKRCKVHATFEPTQYLIGGLVRSYLANDWKSAPECLQLMFCADRAYHLEKEIVPSLKAGVTVVCDRYFFSTVAYGAMDMDLDWLIELNKNFIIPDLTIVLESDPELCIERMAKERFSVELFEKIEILKKIWKNYQIVAKKFSGTANVKIINGDRKIPEIFEEVKEIFQTFKKIK